MKVLAFNGSPRKEWNTATLLTKALDGAASQGADTRLVHLYDLDYKGCRSCFACKTKDGVSYGRCAVKDRLTPILAEVWEADALVLGSPIYYGVVSGEMKSFLERLAFPYWIYMDPVVSLFPRKIATAWIYTMNVNEEQMKARNYAAHLATNERVLQTVFGSCESLYSWDTYQFEDYSRMVAPRYDPEAKAKRRAEVFPADCQQAFALGARLARGTGK
ncbi:MAG TPA: flavodoxin family protein [Candidatus Sulfotelmatobacter sp.]|nr:flavodoxin family protein [Candidatus Sulfotelmatobacter sp.]